MKLKNYLLAGTALIALSFMAACTEEARLQMGMELRLRKR